MVGVVCSDSDDIDGEVLMAGTGGTGCEFWDEESVYCRGRDVDRGVGLVRTEEEEVLIDMDGECGRSLKRYCDAGERAPFRRAC